MPFHPKPIDLIKHPPLARWYTEYLDSPEWKAKREELFTERGKQCERCNSQEDIVVHHKHYERVTKEQLTDLMVLCKSCHILIHRGLNIPSAWIIYYELSLKPPV